MKNIIFAFVILIGNFLYTGKRLALFITDESGQFVVTGIMFNRRRTPSRGHSWSPTQTRRNGR